VGNPSCEGRFHPFFSGASVFRESRIYNSSCPRCEVVRQPAAQPSIELCAANVACSATTGIYSLADGGFRPIGSSGQFGVARRPHPTSRGAATYQPPSASLASWDEPPVIGVAQAHARECSTLPIQRRAAAQVVHLSPLVRQLPCTTVMTQQVSHRFPHRRRFCGLALTSGQALLPRRQPMTSEAALVVGVDHPLMGLPPAEGERQSRRRGVCSGTTLILVNATCMARAPCRLFDLRTATSTRRILLLVPTSSRDDPRPLGPPCSPLDQAGRWTDLGDVFASRLGCQAVTAQIHAHNHTPPSTTRIRRTRMTCRATALTECVKRALTVNIRPPNGSRLPRDMLPSREADRRTVGQHITATTLALTTHDEATTRAVQPATPDSCHAVSRSRDSRVWLSHSSAPRRPQAALKGCRTCRPVSRLF
jgi:hypothetical protein